MNVMIAVNEKYIPHAKVMLASLRHSMPEEHIDTYLLHSGLSEHTINEFRTYLNKKHNINLVDIKLTSTPFDKCKIGMHFSIEITYRLMATEVLPNHMKRIIWLDSDIVINHSIEKLYYADMSTEYISACPGRGLIEKHNERLGLEKKHVYFNTGVVVMNLELMRKENLIERYVDIVNTYGDRLTFLDQDIMNIAFHGTDIKYFDNAVYNCQIGRDFYIETEQFDDFLENCCIMHFAASAKPWNNTYRNGLENYYWKYALQDGRYVEYIKFIIKAPIYSAIMRLKIKKMKQYSFD
jgi:lipopolysaccharide biosynthesis glycosyltransferase